MIHIKKEQLKKLDESAKRYKCAMLQSKSEFQKKQILQVAIICLRKERKMLSDKANKKVKLISLNTALDTTTPSLNILVQLDKLLKSNGNKEFSYDGLVSIISRTVHFLYLDTFSKVQASSKRSHKKAKYQKLVEIFKSENPSISYLADRFNLSRPTVYSILRKAGCIESTSDNQPTLQKQITQETKEEIKTMKTENIRIRHIKALLTSLKENGKPVSIETKERIAELIQKIKDNENSDLSYIEKMNAYLPIAHELESIVYGKK